MTQVQLELDRLSPAERRDLANALLRAAWTAVLEETRIMLLDLLIDVDVDDETALWRQDAVSDD